METNTMNQRKSRWRKGFVFSFVILLLWTPHLFAAKKQSLILQIPGILAMASAPPATKVSLSAFSNFECDGNWSTRDGARGLNPYQGPGTCDVVFPGVNHSYKYSITLNIQTEFDGRSPYQVRINGKTVKSGNYPTSTGGIDCGCKERGWATHCPDKRVNIDVGTFTLKEGDVITFWGKGDYQCYNDDGTKHGSYAKWHGMSFTPIK